MKTRNVIKLANLHLLTFLLLGTIWGANASPVSKTVHAVLFYKPYCPDCEYLMRVSLPKLKLRYGENLSILTVDTSNEMGGTLFLNAMLDFQMPLTEAPPILVFGDKYLSSVDAIEKELPNILDAPVAYKSDRWPNISGLDKVLQQVDTLSSSDQRSWWIYADATFFSYLISDFSLKYQKDPAGNQYAVVVLTSLIICLGLSIFFLFYSQTAEIHFENKWSVLILSLIGLIITWQLSDTMSILLHNQPIELSWDRIFTFIVLLGMASNMVFFIVCQLCNSTPMTEFWQKWSIFILFLIAIIAAGYLGYTSFADKEAVCGAVGDCNAVQQSTYSKLFGVVPVVFLGLAGDLLFIIFWGIYYFGPETYRDHAGILQWILLFIGVCFFTYLTFLEPFIIGETCFWCLTAAVTMALQLLITTRLANQSIKRIFAK